MKTKTARSASNEAARKKLILQIAATQKQADQARKAAKLRKLAFRTARQKFKDAKRGAKKLKKTLKELKAALAAPAVRKVARKPATGKRPRVVAEPQAAPVIIPPPAGVPPLVETVSPATPVT